MALPCHRRKARSHECRPELKLELVVDSGRTASGSAALYAFNMKNRFCKFYADKVDVARTGTAPDEPEMTDIELARRVAFMLREASEKLKRQREGAPETGPEPPLFRKH